MSILSPICYGVVSLQGNISSGTGNFSVNHPAVGIYEISINGEAYSTPLYPTLVTVIKGDDIPFDYEIYTANITTNLANILTVHIKGCFARSYGPRLAGNVVVDETIAQAYYTNSFFSFVVYKP